MAKFVITKPIGGICLNGKEYALCDNKEVMRFDTAIDAKIFLEDNGIMAKDMDEMGIQIEESEA